MCRNVDAGVPSASQHPTHNYPLHGTAFFIVLSPLLPVLEFVAIDLGSKTSDSGFWARKLILPDRVGGWDVCSTVLGFR